MPSITIHNIDPSIYKQLQAQAATAGISLNKLIKSIIRAAVGLSKPSAKPSNFSEFVGTWTKEEAAEFDRITARKIDSELWQDE